MWKPINRHWAFVDKDPNQIQARLPQCLMAAKTKNCILRLLSLNEEMCRAMPVESWTNLAAKEAS